MRSRKLPWVGVAPLLMLSTALLFAQAPPKNLVASGPVTVNITSAIAVGSYQVTITFDKNVVTLEAQNVSGGTGAGFTGQPLVVNTDTPGTVIINHLQTLNAPTGTFSVATLKFTPVAKGTSNLVLTVNALTDTATMDIPMPPASVFLTPSTITVAQKRPGQVTSN